MNFTILSSSGGFIDPLDRLCYAIEELRACRDVIAVTGFELSIRLLPTTRGIAPEEKEIAYEQAA